MAALGRPVRKNSPPFLILQSCNLLSLSAMPHVLDPELRRALAVRIRYYNEMGIYDFYRRPLSDRAGVPIAVDEMGIAVSANEPESGEEMSPRKAAAVAVPHAIDENI